MKIDEVEVGGRYAAHDEPTTSRYGNPEYGVLPREVEVVEIVGVEERIRTGGYYMRSGVSRTKTVRRVKVRVVGGQPSGSRYANEIQTAEPGAVLTIEARKLLGPWADLSADVAKVLRLREEREARRTELEARLVTILGKRALARGDSYVDVRVYGDKVRAELRIGGRDVDTILDLAERAALATSRGVLA